MKQIIKFCTTKIELHWKFNSVIEITNKIGRLSKHVCQIVLHEFKQI